MLIPRTVLAALAPCCDLESSRYALGGVLLQRLPDGNPVAVATDGRRLVAVTWDGLPDDAPTCPTDANVIQSDAFAAIVPQDVCARLGKEWHPSRQERHGKQAWVLMEEGEKPKMYVLDREFDATYDIRLLEGRFPKWRDIVHKTYPADTLTITVDAKLLMQVLTAVSSNAHDTGDNVSGAVRITVVTKGKDANDDIANYPVVVSAVGEHGSKSLGVLMQVTDATRSDGPHWVPPKDAPTAAPIPPVETEKPQPPRQCKKKKKAVAK